MSGGLRIGHIFGIPIYLHPSWLIIFMLIAWGLSATLAAEFPEMAPTARHVAAGIGSALFFFSILLHELGHSVLALHHRVAVRSITLFVFGGVALMEREPDDARAEFQIAIAGPMVSALLALLFAVVERTHALGEVGTAGCELLAWFNLRVAVFNLLPGFPLDGGRILRAVVWAITGNLAKATRTAASGGQLIAYGFIALGTLSVLGIGPFDWGPVGGLWIVLIGWLLLSMSGAAIRQVDLDASLEGLRARDLLAPVPARISAGEPVATFARELVMRGRRWALVEDAGRLVGLITLSDVQRLDPERWESTPVVRVATPADQLLTAAPETPVREILVAMGSRDVNQIPIVEHDRVLGAVTRETLVHAFELRRLSG
jgi:Zn-dependent protease